MPLDDGDTEVSSPDQMADREAVTVRRPPVEPAVSDKDTQPYQPVKIDRKFGRYDLLMEMGRGGMATLYLARILGPEKFEKLLAIKRIHDHLSREQQFIDMFLDEARIAALIHHPNVATTFDLGKIDGAYYIAMEYIHGQNLAEFLRAVIRRGQPVHWSYATRIVADAAAGLHAAHELRSPGGKPLNVVHRDVSPQNILISFDGHVKVLDFGVAYAAEKLVQTASGTMKGKAAYMSPEQTWAEKLDRRSDIFSLGIVLFEAVCMKRLFREESDAATVMRVAKADVPKPRSIRWDVPPELEQIILKALALKPGDRFSTAKEFAEALEDFSSSKGESLSTLKLAGLMDELFYDRKRLKETQLRKALQDEDGEIVRSVVTGPPSGTSLEAQLLDSGKFRTRPRSNKVVAVTGGALLAAAVLVVVLFYSGKLRRSTKKDRRAAAMASSARSRGDADARKPGTVTLKVTIKPKEADAVVTFRGQKHKGTVFKAMLPRSTKPERFEVEAPGYLPESLVLVLVHDNEFTLTLRPAPRVPTGAVGRKARPSRKAGTETRVEKGKRTRRRTSRRTRPRTRRSRKPRLRELKW